jgi:hypothetical protein
MIKWKINIFDLCHFLEDIRSYRREESSSVGYSFVYRDIKKVKVTSNEGPERVYQYRSTVSLTSALD